MPVTSTGKQARTARNDEGTQALWVRGYVGTTSSPVPADVNQEPDGRLIYHIHCIEWDSNEPRAVVPQRRAAMCLETNGDEWSVNPHKAKSEDIKKNIVRKLFVLYFEREDAPGERQGRNKPISRSD
ncbi:unnamed protein product [Calypogeia fissa]